MKEKIEPINAGEQAWIATQLAQATNFMAAYSPQDAGRPLSLAALGRAFSAWMASGAADDGTDANKIINAVGIAFGQFLVEGLEFKWVVATDEHGSELAVYSLPGTGDMLIYPANFVAKRWERQETNFLEQSYARIKADVRSIKRQFEQ